jgi:prefoldin subunit 5
MDRLYNLRREIRHVSSEFSRVFKAYYDIAQSVIAKRVSWLDRLLVQMQPRMAWAHESLVESRAWYRKVDAERRREQGLAPLPQEEEDRPDRRLAAAPQIPLGSAANILIQDHLSLALIKTDSSSARTAAQLQSARDANEELRIEILKERMVRTVMRIATTSFHTRAINKIVHEKKVDVRALWQSQRVCEDNIASMDKDLHDGYNELSTMEVESEKLREEIAEVNKETSKLAHSKMVSLASAHDVLQKIGNFKSDVNIDQLLKKLDQSHLELMRLNGELTSFDEEVESDIRDVMMEIEEYQKAIREVGAENVEIRTRAVFPELPDAVIQRDHEAIEAIKEDNEKLREENEEIRKRIEELTAQIREIEPKKQETLGPLFEYKVRAPVATVSSCYVPGKTVKKPEVNPKSPFARYRFRSRPMFTVN